MHLLDMIKKADLLAKGKKREINQNGVGMDIYTKCAELANILISEWENTMDGDEPVDWKSLYNPSFIIGRVDEGKSLYSIPIAVRKIKTTPLSYVLVKNSDTGAILGKYKIVDQDFVEDPLSSRHVQIASAGLQFSTDFTSKKEAKLIDGDIVVGVYERAPMIYDENDIVPVDNPNWLVNRLAAELVRNDVVKQAQEPRLISIANGLMQRMISDNKGSQEVKTVPVMSRPFTGRR